MDPTSFDPSSLSLGSTATDDGAASQAAELADQRLFDEINGLLELPPHEVEAALEQRLQIARAAGPESTHEQAFLRLVQVRSRGLDGGSEDGLQACHEALSLLKGRATESGRLAALTVLATLHGIRGELDKALTLLEPVLSRARALSWDSLLVLGLNSFSVVQIQSGALQQAVETLTEAAQLAAGGSRRQRCIVRSNLALTLTKWAREQRDEGNAPASWRADAERAVSLLREELDGIHRPSQTSDRTLQYCFGTLASALVVLDELSEARTLLEELRPLYEAANDARAVLFVDTELTRIALQQHDHAEAVRRAGIGLREGQASGHDAELAELYRLEADALEAVGDAHGALRSFRQFHRLHERSVLKTAAYRSQALAVMMDTERARQESRLDALTGLANRRAFDEALAVAAAVPGRWLSLALLDLDFFKQVNDTHGHGEGDAALCHVAELLQSHLRAGDTAARLGGDEFVLLVAGGEAAITSLCSRLRLALRESSRQKWPERTPLTLSIGIAVDSGPVEPQELMARADRALYAVKARGRDGQAVA